MQKTRSPLPGGAPGGGQEKNCDTQKVLKPAPAVNAADALPFIYHGQDTARGNGNFLRKITTWGDFCREVLARGHRKSAHKDGPCFVPGKLSSGMRNTDTVLEIHGLALDYDDLPLDEVENTLDLSGLEALAWTTFSHMAPGKGPRCRVVIPFKTPVTRKPDETGAQFNERWKLIYRHFANLVHPAWDSKCQDSPHLHYLPLGPPQPPAEPRIWRHIGEPLDVSEFEPGQHDEGQVGALPARQPFERFEPILDTVPSGERNSTLASMAGHWIGKGLAFREALELALGWNVRFGSPPLEEKEVRATVASIWRKEGRKATIEPMPLRRAVPAPEPYPLDALGPVLGPATRALQEVIQAPGAICAQSCLAAASLAVQGHADVALDGRRYPLSLFLASVAESGERKSAVDKMALAPARERERELSDQHRADVSTHLRRLEAWKSARAGALKRAKDFLGKDAALQAVGPEPVAPLLPHLLASEPSLEGLQKLLAQGQPSMGLFSDEGGRLIGGHALNDDNALKTAAGFSELWDASAISRVRAGEGASILHGKRVAFHIMMQPGPMERLLSNTAVAGQGLLNRALLAWPEPTAGARAYQAVDLTTDPRIQRYHTRLGDLHRTEPPLRAGTANELEPRALELSAESKALWLKFYGHVEGNLGEGRPYAVVRGFASKAPEHAIRIAGVLALVDDLRASTVGADHMGWGITLAGFYLREAVRLHEAGLSDPGLVLAEKVLAWAQRRGDDVLDLPSVYRNGPGGVRTQAQARAVVQVLAAHGWLTPIKGGAVIDGKPRREVWRLAKVG